MTQRPRQPTRQPQAPPLRDPDRTGPLDRLDLKILDALQKDGRISNLKLAESVALSPTAVLARVQRLTRDGFIVGYEARLNPLKLGAGMMEIGRAHV